MTQILFSEIEQIQNNQETQNGHESKKQPSRLKTQTMVASRKSFSLAPTRKFKEWAEEWRVWRWAIGAVGQGIASNAAEDEEEATEKEAVGRKYRHAR